MKEITPDDFDKIQQATIRNIIAKLKGGKVPTRYERQLLEEAKAAGESMPELPENKWPKNTRSDSKMRNIIIEQFALSERKAYGWIDKLKTMKKKTGWPVMDVLSVIQERRDNAPGTGGPLVDLRRQLIEEQIRGLKIRNDAEAGLLVEKREVEQEDLDRVKVMLEAVKGFMADQTAKHPKHVDLVEMLGHEMLRVLRESIS